MSAKSKVSGSVVAGFLSPSTSIRDGDLLAVGRSLRPADGVDHHRHSRAAQGRRAEARPLRCPKCAWQHTGDKSGTRTLIPTTPESIPDFNFE